MTEVTRRAVAYIAGRIVSGRNTSSIYDHQGGGYTNMGGRVDAGNVSVYDYGVRCHVSGRLPSLYHYGNGSHLQLRVHGKRFDGYDYDSGNHFSGTVSGRSISLYDFGARGYFSYTL